MDYDKLRPEFVAQVMKIKNKVVSNVKVKTLQNQKLNGNMFCSMMESYLKAINEGAVPNIESAWKYMCEEQCNKIYTESLEFFKDRIQDIANGPPKTEEDFNRMIEEAEDKALETYRQRSIGEDANKMLQKMKKKIRNEIQEFKQDNMKRSEDFIRQKMTVYVNEIQAKLNKFQYSSYSEYEEDLKSIFDKYLQDGPKYHGYQKVLQDIHMKLLTQGSKKIFRDVEKKYNVEISKCNEKFNNT